MFIGKLEQCGICKKEVGIGNSAWCDDCQKLVCSDCCQHDKEQPKLTIGIHAVIVVCPCGEVCEEDMNNSTLITVEDKHVTCPVCDNTYHVPSIIFNREIKIIAKQVQ
jgi:hypothetical protein